MNLSLVRTKVMYELARRDLISFISLFEPNYHVGWFHQELCLKLQNFYRDVCDRKSPRLILSVPPRHGKSTIVSKHLPAWVFGHDPNLQIISCSYAASLASKFTREVQRVIDTDLYRNIFPKTRLAQKGRDAYVRTSDQFEIVDAAGVYRSAGVGGGITGLG